GQVADLAERTSMEEPEGLREAVERNAQAVMTGNFNQLMADITPEALAQMMQMAPQGGPPSMAQLPSITGYTIEPVGPDGDAFVYKVTFTSDRKSTRLNSSHVKT